MSESNAPETTVNRFFRKRRRLSDGPNNAEPEITIEKTIEITVRLGESDARIFKLLMSNSAALRDKVDDESTEALQIRRAFWLALTRAGVK